MRLLRWLAEPIVGYRWERYSLWLLVILALTGCASTLTPEEREWRAAIDAENWALCERVYREARVMIVYTEPSMVKRDLVVNECKRVLGDYYADY